MPFSAARLCAFCRIFFASSFVRVSLVILMIILGFSTGLEVLSSVIISIMRLARSCVSWVKSAYFPTNFPCSPVAGLSAMNAGMVRFRLIVALTCWFRLRINNRRVSFVAVVFVFLVYGARRRLKFSKVCCSLIS